MTQTSFCHYRILWSSTLFRFGNLNTSLRGFENNKETASYWDRNICRQSPTTESCFNPSLFLTFVFWGKFERKKLKPCHVGGHESLDDKFKSSRNILIFIVGEKSLFIWLLIIIDGTIEFVQDWRGGSDTEREEFLCFWQSEFLKSSFNAFSRELGG